MAKPWRDVESNPAYQALPDAEKVNAQNEYFESVVKPQIQNSAEVEEARTAFMQRASGGPKPSVAMQRAKGVAGDIGTGALYGSGLGGILRQGKYLVGAEQRPEGIEGAAEAAGDIGGALLMPVAGLRGVATGALAGAGLNASGAMKVAPAFESAVDKYAPKWPEVGAKGQGALKNFVARSGMAPALNVGTQLAKATGSTLIDTGLGLVAGHGAGKITKPTVMGKAPLSEGTRLLEEYGGAPPTSAYLQGPVSGALAKTTEHYSRTNPLLRGITEGQDTKNIEAVSKYLQAKAPEGAARLTGESGGLKSQAVVESAYDTAKKNYEGVMKEVQQLIPKSESKIPSYEKSAGSLPLFEASGEKLGIGKQYSGYGPIAAEKLKQILNRTDFEGPTPESISPESRAIIEKYAKELDNPKLTPAQYDVKVKDFNRDVKLKLNEQPGLRDEFDHYMGEANQILKDTHIDGLNKIQEGLGDKLAATNFDYAVSKGDLFGPFGKMNEGKVEDLPRKILSSGVEFRATAKRFLKPEDYAKLQDVAEGELIQQATDKAGVVNLKKLKSNYMQKYKGFDWRPDQAEHIENLISMMEKAGIQDLDIANPSGTAGTLANMGHLTALGAPVVAAIGGHPVGALQAAGAMAAGTGGLAAFLKGGPMAQRAIRANVPGTPLLTPQQASVAARLGSGLSAVNQMGR